MKYRTDFVTNSSSTSFASAAVASFVALIASCNCTDSGPNEEVEEEVPEEEQNDVFFQKSIMPDAATKLVQGGDPMYLYAQLVKTTEKDLLVLVGALPSIRFELKSGAGWVQLGQVEIVDEWAAIEVLGIASQTSAVAPDEISIKAKGKNGKKTYSTTFTLYYEAEPTLVVKPAKYNFLSQSAEMAEFEVAVINPGPDPWNLSVEGDNWANQICSYELVETPETNGKTKLQVTECDTESISGTTSDHYSKGKITVRGSSGEKEASDSTDIYVWREGLFRESLLDTDRESGDILVDADKNTDGEMKSSTFDLRYMRWNAEARALKCNTAVFSGDEFSLDTPEALDEKAEAVLESCQVQIKYEGERPSNLPSGKFSVKMDKVIPGLPGQRYRFSVHASIDNGTEYFEATIPFAIVPAVMSADHADWQLEYENCKKIITTFLPESKRAMKLSELENCKHYMGVGDLRAYRRGCWDIAQDIIMKQRADYEAEAAWYDNALYMAEWVQWLNDRAFNLVLSTLTGPVGAIIAGQGKELIQDCIEKFVTVKSTESWTDIGWELIGKRAQSTLGGSIDAGYFGDPEVSKKWIVSFFVYKWIWHWIFDEENGARKGCLEGIKAACWDLSGSGLEEKLKPFVSAFAQKGGYNQNMAIEEYLTKTMAAIKPYLMTFYSDESSGPKTK